MNLHAAEVMRIALRAYAEPPAPTEGRAAPRPT